MRILKIETDGLIIGEQSVGEKDRLVTVLTRKLGVIRAFVKNCKSLKSAKGKATRLLSYSRFWIYQRREAYIIDDAISEKIFVHLRTDIVKMSLAEYFCELARYLAPQETEAESYLRLILNALYLLDSSKRSDRLIKAVVELQLMTISGYMPDLVCCCECKVYEKEEMYFLPKSGKLICGDCIGKTHEYAIHTGKSVTTAMRHCIYSAYNKLFNFRLPTEQMKVLECCTEEYLMFTTEHQFKTLAFYKSFREES